VRVRRTESAGHLAEAVGAPFLDLLLSLVPKTGTGSGSDGAANDGSRRASHGASDQRPADRARATTDAGTGLVVAIDGFTGNRAADGTDDPAHGGTDRAAHDSPDAGAGKCACARTRGLGCVLFVLRGGAVTGPIVGPANLVVMMAHGGSP
jgi:hypothetical protein